MSYAYEESYREGRRRSVELVREVEQRRRVAERAPYVEVRQPKEIPFWVWFRSAFTSRDRFRPASAF